MESLIQLAPLAADKAWYAISWVDGFSIIGLPLTIVGLFLTWQQAKAASTSAIAAKRAVRKTQSHIRANQLLVIIPQLRWISTELDAALETNNAPLARRHLDVWRSQAGQVHGILSSVNPGDSELLQMLNESVGLAAVAGTALLSDQQGSALKRCSKARTSIGTACDRLTVWVGENATSIPSGDANDD